MLEARAAIVARWRNRKGLPWTITALTCACVRAAKASGKASGLSAIQDLELGPEGPRCGFGLAPRSVLEAHVARIVGQHEEQTDAGELWHGRPEELHPLGLSRK
jgi:hypothetical protein